MVNKGYLKIPTGIFEEFLARDFTKKQIKVLNLIMRLSWGCQNNSAVIPTISAFACCGLHRQDVAGELEFLNTNKVIFMEKEANTYAINTDFSEWSVQYSRNSNKNELNRLIGINLKRVFEGSNLLQNDEKNSPVRSENFFGVNGGKPHKTCKNVVSINNPQKNFLNNENKNFSIEKTKKLIEEKLRIKRSSPLDTVTSKTDAIEYLRTFTPTTRYCISSNLKLMEKYGIIPEEVETRSISKS